MVGYVNRDEEKVCGEQVVLPGSKEEEQEERKLGLRLPSSELSYKKEYSIRSQEKMCQKIMPKKSVQKCKSRASAVPTAPCPLEAE
jgi:hypothetical protein